MSDKYGYLSVIRPHRGRIAFLELVVALALLLAGGCGRASSDAAPEPVVEPEAPVEMLQTEQTPQIPKIEFESLEYDYGEVVPRAKAVGVFKVRNAGAGPLEISEVQKCCVAVLNWSKKTLAPGEESELRVTYTFLYVGAVKKNLYVSSNDPEDPRVTLTIKGNVVRKVEWTPARLKLFLNQENAGARPIQIKSLDGTPFAIKEFKATGDVMTADVDPQAEATEFTITPKVDLAKLSQMQIPQGRVEIFHTHPGAETIGMNYDLLPRFSLTPPRIIVFSATPERKEKRKLWVLDNYSEEDLDEGSSEATERAAQASSGQDYKVDFEIESVECRGGSIAVLSTDKIKNGYQLSLEISPPEPQAGSRSFNDELMIKIKGDKALPVKVGMYYSNKARARAN